MNASKLLAVTALATLATMGAHADEAEGSQFVLKVVSTRSRAEVHAEAVIAARTVNPEPRGSRVLERVKPTQERSMVRAEAVQALRRGQIPRGEEHSL